MTSFVDENTADNPQSRCANRDQALHGLVPKMLRIIVAEGSKLPELGGRSIQLGAGLELSASDRLGPNRIMLSAYSPSGGRMIKVFSAHVTDDPNLGDPAFYRYAGGSIGVMSWRRGEWEESVLNHAAQARSASDLLSSGLLGTE